MNEPITIAVVHCPVCGARAAVFWHLNLLTAVCSHGHDLIAVAEGASLRFQWDGRSGRKPAFPAIG